VEEENFIKKYQQKESLLKMKVEWSLSKFYQASIIAIKKNIVHRDIKPENILLNDTKDFERIKLIDFGTSIKLQDEDE